MAQKQNSIAGRIWKKRKSLVRLVRRCGRAVLRLYHWLPVSLKLRMAIKDFVFLAVEHLIVNTPTFQFWRVQRIGLSRVSLWLTEKDFTEAFPPAVPSEPVLQEAWAALVPRANASPVVDIIIPVYKGYEQTLRAIYQVLATPNRTAAEVIVINDASPDLALSEKLRALAAQGLFTLRENVQNLGFVETVNLGMNLHPNRDVVLVNADTEVYGDWLDRLVQAAYSDENVASVTPLSNNAEICSYPFFVRDNYMALELPYAELDAMTAQVNAGRYVAAPTGVGFCMYIRRHALNVVGLFDAVKFGKGYGEENDFCLRASAKGWKHLIAGDIFVRHVGGASFGKEKQKRIARAMRTINRAFPHYRKEVMAFVAADPMQPIRRALDVARLKRALSDKTMLFVSHRLGGGTERHIQDMAAALAREGVSALVLRPDALEAHKVALSHLEIATLPNMLFDLALDGDELMEICAELSVRHMHVHHLIGFDLNVMEYLEKLRRHLAIEYDFTAHDFFSICPRINLIDGSGVYCGLPDVKTCEQCVRTHGSKAPGPPVWYWLSQYEKFFKGASHVFTPSEDTARRLQQRFPDVAFAVRPHGESLPATPSLAVERKPGEVLRVGIIGAIGPHKGSEILLACAQDAKHRGLPIHFHLVGSADLEDLLLACGNVSVTGTYREEEVYNLLQGCHMAFFASVWPETFCYTLTIALNARLFPVAFDLGAPADRLRAAGWGALLPVSMMQDAAAINDQLLGMDVPPPPATIPILSQDDLYPRFVRDYYDRNLGSRP